MLSNAGHGGMYGLQLVHESNGQVKRGTVYVTLFRMEEKGLVLSRAVPKAGRESGARHYRVAALGTRRLADIEAVRATISGKRLAT